MNSKFFLGALGVGVGAAAASAAFAARKAHAAPPPTGAPPGLPPPATAPPPDTKQSPAPTEAPATTTPATTTPATTTPATTTPSADPKEERFVYVPPTRAPGPAPTPAPTGAPGGPESVFELKDLGATPAATPPPTPAPTPYELVLITDPPGTTSAPAPRRELLINADVGTTQGVVLRPAGAPSAPTPGGGRAWLDEIRRLPEARREAAIVEAFSSGRWPRFLRQMVPIRASIPGHEATYWVMPDVLSVGTDADFVRVPMKPATAQRVADLLGMLLPTPKVVDDIDRSATVRLTPRPLRTEMQARRLSMNSLEAWARADELAEAERAGRAGLLSGHKKHIVIHPRMGTIANRRRLWIYGWFYPTAEAALRSGAIPAAEARSGRRHIQSVSTAHDDQYVDYSHGVHLVSRHMQLDGRPADMVDVLRDPSLHALLASARFPSDPRYPT